jgi:adenylate cyclase class 2
MKVLVDGGPTQIYDRLKNQSYKHIIDVREIDYYLDTPDHSLAKRDEALRVRISKDANDSQSVEKVEVTYKGPKIDTISKTREELSFHVQENQIDAILDVFQRLGFPEVYEINKWRSLWQHSNGTLVSVDLVDQLAPDCYVEAEIVTENFKDREQLIWKLEKLLSKLLGFKGELQSEKRSYLELAINRRQIVI